MPIKHSIAQMLRESFPDTMLYRDMKVYHRAQLKKLNDYKSMTEDDIVSRIKTQYKENTDHTLNLDNPKRFTEKIQWRKVYDRNPVYSQLSDKYAVRDWVAKKIGEEHLIPLLGVWERFDDIDFDKLPNQFVLKTNNGSGTNTIVTDKSKLNIKLLRENYNYWLKFPFGYNQMELHYNSIKPLIIAEEYMKSSNFDSTLTDYKFLCFDGIPYCCWVDIDRFIGHKRKIFSTTWESLPWCVGPFEKYDKDVSKPKALSDMLEIVGILSSGFAHTRVDLYEINNKVYFGEMTFTFGSGYELFAPDEWDYKIGGLWDITVPQVDYNKIFSC